MDTLEQYKLARLGNTRPISAIFFKHNGWPGERCYGPVQLFQARQQVGLQTHLRNKRGECWHTGTAASRVALTIRRA